MLSVYAGGKRSQKWCLADGEGKAVGVGPEESAQNCMQQAAI